MENKKRNPGGQPTKFTVAKGEAIVARIRTHLSVHNAAGKVKESHQTVFNWLKYGERDLIAGKDTHFAHFFANVCEARADKVAELIEVIESMPKSWQAISWLLEKCCREEFGKESSLYQDLLDDYKHLMQVVLDAKGISNGR